MADRNDDHTCRECGAPLAPEQRYCVKCGARRGLLPGAVAGTVAAMSPAAKPAAPGAAKAGSGAHGGGAQPTDGGAGDGGGKGSAGPGNGHDAGGDGGGWRWMPSPPAIAIAVIGMLALGVGLGSAMSEIASSAPLSTILLEYPRHAVEGAPPAEEPEEEEFTEAEPEETVVAEAPEEAPPPLELPTEPLPEEPLPLETPPEEATEEKSPLQESIEQVEREEREREEEKAGGVEEPLPEVKHAFLIVLGESGYEETWGTEAPNPYLSRTLPEEGELLPNYYGVTSGVLANEIALLSGQGPTAETAANCPDYTAIAPGIVSVFAEQVEGNGCVYGKEVKSLPAELSEEEVTWRAYVQDMEKGGALGQPFRCRKPALGGPDWSPTPSSPEDLYVTWRNPVVYFSAIAEGDECEKHDVGFEILTKDLAAKKRTPTLSLIFPEAAALPTLVPAIMASPAYEEGGMIMITSAQAKATGDGADQKACCLVPEFPNLPPTNVTKVEPPYTEESVRETAGGGKVGLLMISPFVEAGEVEEAEYANHFTLLKTLASMLGVEPMGYAAEEEVPTLSADLFLEPTEATEPPAEVTQARRAAAGPPVQAGLRPGTF